MKRVCLSLIPLLAILILPSCLKAAEFPPITEEERAIVSVPGEPNAPAAVLFQKGEFLMMGYGQGIGSRASHLRIQVRMKILTEEGKSRGEITVQHSDATRLESFEGRTVLPDGRIVPVPAQAKFLRKTSRSKKTFETAMAFPAVEVGAILDYQYETVFKSPWFLEPWHFSDEVPVRYSEIVFKTATGWHMNPWIRSPVGVKIQQDYRVSAEGEERRAWAVNVPSVLQEPLGPPAADLSTQMLLLPTAYFSPELTLQLMQTWEVLAIWMHETYEKLRRKDSGVAQQARGIAGSGSQRQKAEALYRFVRDQIKTEPGVGIFADPEFPPRKVLAERRGEPAGKALLLQVMLKAVGIDSLVIWAADRSRGAIDTKVPSPYWFDTLLVGVQVDNETVFLDPSDTALAFGQLRAGYEGAWALIAGARQVRSLTLPQTPFDQNVRRAEIDLALDDAGRLSGKGSLLLTGQHAWQKIDWQEDEASTLKAWTDWLAEHYRDFQISDVKAAELPDERKVTVTWSMAQREEEVLGDESSLAPCAPLGPVTQPLVQSAASRKTKVMFEFADRDEVELRLRWPEGWEPESLPAPAAVQKQVGALDAGVEMKREERSLVYRRRFDITRKTLGGSEDYVEAQALFAEAEKSDAQKLFLVRR
jgi:Domain of Unknown Function with PDB structure (DUF3857)